MMAPLDSRWFSGTDNVPEFIAENLEVPGFGYPVHAAMGKNGWEGEVAACIGLELSPDNTKVVRGQLILRGHLSKEEPAVVQASKLWDAAAKDVTISITMPSAAEFDLAAGTMTSDYLPSDGLKVACAKAGVAIPPAQLAQHGIGKFCLRLYVQLARPVNNGARPAVQFSVMFFPHTFDEMLEWSDMVKAVGWPGIKILEGEAQLFPAAPEGEWGCPIFPLLCPGTRFEQVPNLPCGSEMRRVISTIFNTARQPNSYATHANLKRKWGKMLADEEEYVERMPFTSWPAAPEPQINTGECLNFFFKHKKHRTHTRTHTQTHTHIIHTHTHPHTTCT